MPDDNPKRLRRIWLLVAGHVIASLLLLGVVDAQGMSDLVIASRSHP